MDLWLMNDLVYWKVDACLATLDVAHVLCFELGAWKINSEQMWLELKNTKSD